MKNKIFFALALVSTTPFLHAQSIGYAESNLDFLYITPRAEGAIVSIDNPWAINVYSSSYDQISGADTQSDGGNDFTSYSVESYAFFAGGGADFHGKNFLDPFGGAGGGAGSFSPDTYSAGGASFTSMANTFRITAADEGEGQTCVDFVASIYNAATAASLGAGYSATAYTSFTLFIGNIEAPLLSHTFSFASIGDDFYDDTFEGDLSGVRLLDYNTDYEIYISMFSQITADGDGSDPFAEPVPEASTVFATAAAIGVAALRRRKS